MRPSSTVIGLVAGIGLLLAGGMLEGSAPTSFFNLPAALIVIGGTAAATLAGTSVELFRKIPQLYRKAFSTEKPDLGTRLELLVSLAEQARREGLLALDRRLDAVEDPYTRKGLQLVVDGADPDIVRSVMENDIDGVASRHRSAVNVFEKGAGFAPTMGILGTVMGLVQVLSNLATPETVGPAISSAFIATLYGVGMANCILFPVANRLRQLSGQELELYAMTLEGVLAIQAGDNPRVLTDKLVSFLPPEDRPDGLPLVAEDELMARADELAAA